MDFNIIYTKLEKIDEKLDKVGIDVAVLNERLTQHIENDSIKFNSIEPHVNDIISEKVLKKNRVERITYYTKIVGFIVAIVGAIPILRAMIK